MYNYLIIFCFTLFYTSVFYPRNSSVYSGDFAVNGAQLSGRYRDGEPWGASYAFELSGDGKTLTMISQTDKAEESVYTRTAIPEEVRNAPEVRSALSGALLRIF